MSTEFFVCVYADEYGDVRMDEIRGKLQSAGLQTYDCLSPTLMDLLATHSAKAAGTFKAK